MREWLLKKEQDDNGVSKQFISGLSQKKATMWQMVKATKWWSYSLVSFAKKCEKNVTIINNDGGTCKEDWK